MDPKINGKQKGPDGMSKKERRALKVAAEGKNINAVEVAKKEVPKEVSEMKNTSSVENGVQKNVPRGSSKMERRAVKVATSLSGKSENKPEVTVVEVKNQDVPKVETSKEECEGSKDGGVSKAELRAQRRAVQEAQRLAKLNVNKEKVVVVTKVDEKAKLVPTQPATTKRIGEAEPKQKIQLFNHLNIKKFDVNDIDFNFDDIHPVFYYLGSCYASKSIIGSNSRCLKMLTAIKTLIEDFNTPPDEEFRRSFKSKLRKSINYLKQCRPFAFSMSNAIQHIQLFLNDKLDVSLSECEQKAAVINFINGYVNEEFEKASQSISTNVTTKMLASEVILVYGHSSVVVKTLIDAHHLKKNFKVVIIDCGPLYEGRKTLSKLESIGICCTYAHITRIASVITLVTKVLLGANALFGNGCIMARTGTANVALIARIHNKSIMFCLESNKYADAIQADAFVHNEIDGSSYKHKYSNKKSLNIMYDVTLPSMYDWFITEIGSFHSLNAHNLMRCKALRAKKAAA